MNTAKQTYKIKRLYTIISIIIALILSLTLLSAVFDGYSQFLIIYRNHLLLSEYSDLGLSSDIERYGKIIRIDEKLSDSKGFMMDNNIVMFDKLNLELLYAKQNYEIYFEFKNQYEIALNESNICYKDYDINNNQKTNEDLNKCIEKINYQIDSINNYDRDFNCLNVTKEYLAAEKVFFNDLKIYNDYILMQDAVNSTVIKNSLEKQATTISDLRDKSFEEYQSLCPNYLLDEINRIENALSEIEFNTE